MQFALGQQTQYPMSLLEQQLPPLLLPLLQLAFSLPSHSLRIAVFLKTVRTDCWSLQLSSRSAAEHMRPNTCRCLVTCPTLCACLSCRNLVAMCLVFCYQKHLSLRTQVVNPLVLVFIVLASTAALVSGLEGKGRGICPYWYQQGSP